MSYRRLVRSTNPLFLPLGILARLPYAIAPLGTLLLLKDTTGSYAFAGAAAGAQSLAIAVGGIAVGALANRIEPRTLGSVAAAVNALSTIALIASSRGDRSSMLIAAVLVGLTQPQVGPLVRAHWSNYLHTRRRELLPTALSCMRNNDRPVHGHSVHRDGANRTTRTSGAGDDGPVRRRADRNGIRSSLCRVPGRERRKSRRVCTAADRRYRSLASGPHAQGVPT
jgi:hypothetical protein